VTNDRIPEYDTSVSSWGLFWVVLFELPRGMDRRWLFAVELVEENVRAGKNGEDWFGESVFHLCVFFSFIINFP
jgi:hypothetical protein